MKLLWTNLDKNIHVFMDDAYIVDVVGARKQNAAYVMDIAKVCVAYGVFEYTL
jgi:hypothetical protein